jgi:hypothetical protein
VLHEEPRQMARPHAEHGSELGHAVRVEEASIDQAQSSRDGGG